MKDELGNDVHRSSLEAYKSIMHPPSRWPWVLCAALVVTLLGFVVERASNVANSYLCAKNQGVWNNGVCKPPTIEVKYYNVTIDPGAGEDPPQSDIPKPPPVPSSSSQAL